MIFSPPQLTFSRYYTKIRYLLVLLRSQMSKNTSITLGDHFDGFVTYQIKSGRYGSVSEVIRAGLRALEDNESKILALSQMLMDGDKSGPADYSYETLIAELDRERRESKE